MAKSFTVRINEDLHKELKSKCASKGITVQEAVVEMVQKYVVSWGILIENLKEKERVCIDHIELSPKMILEELARRGFEKVEFTQSDKKYLRLIK